MKIDYLLCADWGKEVSKRKCYVVDIHKKRFELLDERELTFKKLVDRGLLFSKKGPTLLSLDLAIGVPKQFLSLACKSIGTTEAFTFVNWLASKKLDSNFWIETNDADKWSTDRPFISVPGEEGALTRFHQMAGHDLKRSSDRQFGGKSPFVVNGFPGTVGSGTRSFWRELHPYLQEKKSFGLWPFDGDLGSLLKSHQLVVAENYPAVSYTAVFADKLPSKQLLLSKVNKEVREAAIKHLGQLDWIKETNLELLDLESCIGSEDNFDALMVSLALFRLIVCNVGIVDHLAADSKAEGGILGSNAIKNRVIFQSLDRILGVKHSPKKSKGKDGVVIQATHVCPICGHQFKQARNGWRDHINSVNRHPNWHTEVTDKKARQELFEQEHPEFFQ